MPLDTLDSTRRLNCPLTRHLEVVATLHQDSDKASLAALMLSFLGHVSPARGGPDFRNLGQLMEMLAEQRANGLHAELSNNCRQCPVQASCHVGRIVLKA